MVTAHEPPETTYVCEYEGRISSSLGGVAGMACASMDRPRKPFFAGLRLRMALVTVDTEVDEWTDADLLVGVCCRGTAAAWMASCAAINLASTASFAARCRALLAATSASSVATKSSNSTASCCAASNAFCAIATMSCGTALSESGETGDTGDSECTCVATATGVSFAGGVAAPRKMLVTATGEAATSFGTAWRSTHGP